VRQYAAPTASLLAVTGVVLAVHYGIQKHAATPPAHTTTTHVRRPPTVRTAAVSRFYIVQRGDSFSVIAEKTKTSVARLEQLNPKASPTALRVGQRIRVK
jgi:LysM repeat protein